MAITPSFVQAAMLCAATDGDDAHANIYRVDYAGGDAECYHSVVPRSTADAFAVDIRWTDAMQAGLVGLVPVLVTALRQVLRRGATEESTANNRMKQAKDAYKFVRNCVSVSLFVWQVIVHFGMFHAYESSGQLDRGSRHAANRQFVLSFGFLFSRAFRPFVYDLLQLLPLQTSWRNDVRHHGDHLGHRSAQARRALEAKMSSNEFARKWWMYAPYLLYFPNLWLAGCFLVCILFPVIFTHILSVVTISGVVVVTIAAIGYVPAVVLEMWAPTEADTARDRRLRALHDLQDLSNEGSELPRMSEISRREETLKEAEIAQLDKITEFTQNEEVQRATIEAVVRGAFICMAVIADAFAFCMVRKPIYWFTIKNFFDADWRLVLPPLPWNVSYRINLAFNFSVPGMKAVSAVMWLILLIGPLADLFVELLATCCAKYMPTQAGAADTPTDHGVDVEAVEICNPAAQTTTSAAAASSGVHNIGDVPEEPDQSAEVAIAAASRTDPESSDRVSAATVNGGGGQALDRIALEVLYHALGGRPSRFGRLGRSGWIQQDGWLGDIVAEWHGVKVDYVPLYPHPWDRESRAKYGLMSYRSATIDESRQEPPLQAELRRRVTGLNLPHNELRGEVPAEIGYLTHLVRLNISGNSISSLPSAISLCTALEVLDASSNPIVSLPSGLTRCSRLHWLDLCNTSIVCFPHDMANLFGFTNLAESDCRRLRSTYLEPQADRGDSFALCWLGICCAVGGVAGQMGDAVNAARLWEQAAANEYVVALVLLSSAYANATFGVHQDMDKADELFQRATSLRYPGRASRYFAHSVEEPTAATLRSTIACMEAFFDISSWDRRALDVLGFTESADRNLNTSRAQFGPDGRVCLIKCSTFHTHLGPEIGYLTRLVKFVGGPSLTSLPREMLQCVSLRTFIVDPSSPFAQDEDSRALYEQLQLNAAERRAADGDPEGHYRLGLLCERGVGCGGEPDLQRAVAHFEQAVLFRHGRAALHAGKIWMVGTPDHAKDHECAMVAFILAEIKLCPWSVVGKAGQRSQELSSDGLLAKQSLAALRGDLCAQYLCGALYCQEGEQVSALDRAVAREFLLLAAEQDTSSGQVHRLLGDMVRRGGREGTAAQQALHHYEQAAEMGDAIAAHAAQEIQTADNSKET